MTTLFINDEEVTAPAGTSILEACQQSGVDVPYFCYHPELSVAANCRMCLVHVEGWNKPAASCCTPISEGMKVYTQTEDVQQDRKMVMEYLLINHPLDCPVCDQGGDCKLQDYAMDYGASRGRYAENKRAAEDYELGPFITTCMTRCIHCTRCVRFADEVAGTGDMGVLNRGDRMSIAGIVDECLSSELSGNLADICPVGALLDGPSHDVARPWELTSHKSTCTQCPQGCDIAIESRGEEVIRIQPVKGSPEPWLCDRGRYVYDAFRSDRRILQPMMRESGEMIAADWDEVMARAAELLTGKRVGIVFSPFWSVEGIAAIRLMRDALFPEARVAFDLHRRDMRPFAFEEGFAQTTQQIEDADEVVILGSDLRQRLPLVMQRLRKRLRADKPVTRIGAMNYRTNAAPTHDLLIRPSDWPAVIARAMQQVMDLGKPAAGMVEWMEQVEGRHEAGKALADALMADSCSLLVGEEIRSHPDAAALIAGLDLLMRGCGHAEEGRDGRNLVPEGMNAQALSAIFGDVRVGAGELFDAAANGELDALLLIGSDPVGDGLFPSHAKEAMAKVPLVQVGAIRGEISDMAEVMLPSAAYSEVEGSFINMEGRVRVATQPLKSLGTERPLWKVMMRLVQALGVEVPAVDMDELRTAVKRFLPDLSGFWEADEVDAYMMPTRRNPKAVYMPAKSTSQSGKLDVVSRYSVYREGIWARASDLLANAGRLHALDDVLVHPDTLREAGLEEGELTIVSSRGEHRYHVGTRLDVSPGVLFVAKRGVAGDLSDESVVELRGGTG
ncbi:MAG TPA: NADH-quinone oxidoreductase subunit NuoG [Mariprofundaceae bacterium]|nr:NADH-quinone oxidoreductase subunit NuoG [Mariprofundaceae bacterium]